MSFGIRNVPDRRAALREIARVAKPTATVAILELHAPRRGPLAAVAKAAIWLLPTVLGTLGGASQQYQHLQRSILSFPDDEEWRSQMAIAGLPVVHAKSMCYGAVWLYVAQTQAAYAAHMDRLMKLHRTAPPAAYKEWEAEQQQAQQQQEQVDEPL
jgi:demethylmenaquinone methyltransferase / 2-methoxy-6-polyprenyl-1,4-benzoquinol methylase